MNLRNTYILFAAVIAALVVPRIARKAQPPPKAHAGPDPPSAAVSLIKGDKPYRVMLGQLSLASGGTVYAAAGDKPDKVVVLHQDAIRDLLKPGAEGIG